MIIPHVTCILATHFQLPENDPADRDEHGRYVGVQSLHSDHGRAEAAYLASVAAFAQESGVTYLAVREPGLVAVNFGLEPTIDGYGLAGLLPPDLTGFHDGARVSIAVGLDLVRAMLRDNGAFCRLEAEGRFFVHVGYDQYGYVGSAVPCERSVAFAHDHGLFTEPVAASPLAAEVSDDTAGTRQPADAAWWATLASLVTQRGAVMLEEGYVLNASRWHRVAAADADTVQARLAPRARLLVWPDLSTDIDTVVAGLAPDHVAEVVWQYPDGRIASRLVDEDSYAGLPALLAGAHAALVVSHILDQRHPLLTGVLPDADGVVRARWSAE